MNSIDFETVDQKIAEIDAEQSNSEQSEKQQFAKDYQIDEYIFQIEKMGVKYLESIHEKLSIPDDELKVNSEMWSTVLQKHFSLDTLKNTPEFMAVGHTAMLGMGIWKVYSELKSQGEIE